MKVPKLLLVAAVGVSVVAMPAHAQIFASPLGGAGYTCYNSASGDCFANAGGNYIWHTGDYWQKDATGTGLSSVNAVAWSFDFNDSASQDFTFEVLVNGQNAGSWFMPVGTGSPSGSFLSFAPVAAVGIDEYTVRWEISSGVCEGCLTVQLTDLDQSQFKLIGDVVVATPEPASIALLATGLVGVAGVVRRRKK